MYAVIIQDLGTLRINKVIECPSLYAVQEELEIIEPDMDSEYIINGDISAITFNETIYHVAPLYASKTTQQRTNS